MIGFIDNHRLDEQTPPLVIMCGKNQYGEVMIRST